MDKKYFMVGLASERVQASGDISMRFVREISKELFDKAEVKTKRLLKLSREETLYTVVKLNYFDIRDAIKAALDNANNFNTNYELQDLYNNLNRHVLNFLSAIKTYLDHTGTQLDREYGKTSTEFLLFKKLTGELFDSKFSYRFLDDLRDYAQHCGFPTGEIFIDSVYREDEKDVVSTLNLNVVRDDLKNKFSGWHKTIKVDLPNQAEKFDLIPLLTEKYLDLEKLNQTICRSRYHHFEEDARFLLELMKEASVEGGFPILAEEEVVLTTHGGKLSTLYFPYKEIERILNLKIEFNPLFPIK